MHWLGASQIMNNFREENGIVLNKRAGTFKVERYYHETFTEHETLSMTYSSLKSIIAAQQLAPLASWARPSHSRKESAIKLVGPKVSHTGAYWIKLPKPPSLNDPLAAPNFAHHRE